MAMLFAYLELAASLFILLLAFQIWTRHYENKVARFYGLFAITAFLAAILTYSLRIAFTLELAADINRLSATLWSVCFAMYVHFVLLFTKKQKCLENPLCYLPIYLPPAVIGFLFIFTNQMYLRHEIWNIGIVSVPAPPYSLFAVQTVACCVWGVFLLFNYARSSPQKTERLQAIVIMIASIIPIAVGAVNDMLLPTLFGIRLTPPSVVFDMALMNLLIFLAMRRYALFAISPALAADTIIETMPDSLIVTDLPGRIIFINEEAQKFFHVSVDEIAGRRIVDLFQNPDDFYKLYRQVTDKKELVEKYRTSLVDKLGKEIKALVNARLLREKVVGETLGIVFVIRDTRD
jgi:PAS domain S-box-containing protein